MIKNSVIPENPDDKSLLNEWKGVLTGNQEGVQSFVLNAITALRSFSNSSVAQITSKTSFSFDDLRKEKTAIFFITPAKDTEYYAFLISMFFRLVFNASMRKIPGKDDLSLYILYDELGHSTIPNFLSTLNTIREYRVSISGVLQNISQITARYGKDYKAILGSFTTYLTYSGSDPETTKFFEAIMGKTRITQLPGNLRDYEDRYREEFLMLSNEIRTLSQNDVLIVSSNRDPVRTNVVPFYKQGHLRRMAKRDPTYISKRNLKAIRYTEI